MKTRDADSGMLRNLYTVQKTVIYQLSHIHQRFNFNTIALEFWFKTKEILSSLRQSGRRYSPLQGHRFAKSRKERGKIKPWNVTIDISVAGDLFRLIAPRSPIESDLGSEDWVHIQLQDGPKSFLVDLKGTRRTHGGGRGAEGLPSLFDPGSVEGQDHVFVILWISWVYYLIFIPGFYFLINDKRNCSTASAVSLTISLVKLDSHV